MLVVLLFCLFVVVVVSVWFGVVCLFEGNFMFHHTAFMLLTASKTQFKMYSLKWSRNKVKVIKNKLLFSESNLRYLLFILLRQNL